MKIKIDTTGKVIAVLTIGESIDYIDAPDVPDDHKFGVIDYSYINGVYTKIVNQIENNSEQAVSYEQKVIELIRQRYSIDEELAIQRQKDTKPDKFQQYFDYCEQCKTEAKN